MAKKKQPTPLSSEAIDALRAASFGRNTFSLTTENLPCYSEIKALVSVLGGKWVSGRGEHVFADSVDAEALILGACDAGVIPATNPGDFFPTPAPIVQLMVEGSDIDDKFAVIDALPDHPVRYLEPSGGAGALAAVMHDRLRPGDELVIVEMDPLLASSLRKKFPRATVVEGDFLEYRTDRLFDVVLMNPPFAGKLYLKHVRQAFAMLTPFGVLCSVVPSSFRTHDEAFVFDVAEAGQWMTLGKKCFEGTECDTSIIWMKNDPDRFWRNQPHEGYTCHHAWGLAVAIASDQAMLTKLSRCSNVDAATEVLQAYAKQLMHEHQAPMRCTPAIAQEVITSLKVDFSFKEVEHLKTEIKAGQLDLTLAA